MYSVVMRTIFDVVYTVERGISYFNAMERITWLLANNDEEYFHDLLVNRLQIIDTETGELVVDMGV